MILLERWPTGRMADSREYWRLGIHTVLTLMLIIAAVIGKPGEASAAKRTVTMSMKEKDDGAMVFEPAVLKVKQGETIRLKFNTGETDHEFVMDRHKGIQEHKALMQKFPEMEHADPNSIRLAAGEKGEIIWTFAKAGEFGFACLIPGHYESGMKGEITVTP
jgi:uncharacterized cupredoxin-like copper-binding protein